MQNIPEETGELFFKYIRNELTAEEAAVLESWLNESARNRQFFEQTVNSVNLMEEIKDWQQALKEMDRSEAWKKLMVKNPGLEGDRLVYPRYKWFRYAVAAAVVVMVAGLWIFVLRPDKRESIAKTENTKKPASDKAPGKDGAILKLANGQEIVLDSAANGLLVLQGKSEVVKKDGLLSYSSSATKGEIFYNTLSTPRGRQFQIALPDGSRVWLNSASSIRFPVTFDEKRKVEITGEAYFEVAASRSPAGKRSFVVSVNGMEVEVLGTHFNINSYSDEDVMKTTLLEGKVKIRSTTTNAQAILSPGEQAQINRQDQTINKIKDVDVDAEVAWRFGFFQFNNADLKTVMRQLERWYDVEVEYKGNVSDFEFLGKIPRNMNLSQVLAILQKQNVRFKMEGKKIIVSP